MPATSIRDLVFKDADVVVATHGRSFWIMDDIAPLRQLTPATAAADAVLYKPESAIRVRWDMNTDTPLPQEEPAGENPPDGAIIDYYLKTDASGPVTLEILDGAGKVVRHYSSTDTLYTVPDVNIPTYWIRPQQLLSAKAGAHRFVWDLHYQPLNVPASYPIAAVYANTAPEPTSPWALPGGYMVRLTAGGKTWTQPLAVRMDPRVKTSAAVLQQQFSLSMEAYEGRKRAMAAYDSLWTLRGAIAAALPGANEDQAKTLHALDSRAAALAGVPHRGRGGAPSAGNELKPFSQLQNDYAGLFGILEGADAAPTMQVQTALQSVRSAFRATDAALAQLEKEMKTIHNRP
jgi:hypothetical protein